MAKKPELDNEMYLENLYSCLNCVVSVVLFQVSKQRELFENTEEKAFVAFYFHGN